MAGKCVIIIVSGAEEKQKAMVGITYSLNVKRNNLLDDVKVIFFGPSENAIADGDVDFVSAVRKLMDLKIMPIACSGVANRQNLNPGLQKMGLLIDNVGPIISNYIKEGYEVITF